MLYTISPTAAAIIGMWVEDETFKLCFVKLYETKNNADAGPLPIITEPTPEYNYENKSLPWKLAFFWRRVSMVSIGYNDKSTGHPAIEPA